MLGMGAAVRLSRKQVARAVWLHLPPHPEMSCANASINIDASKADNAAGTAFILSGQLSNNPSGRRDDVYWSAP
jgi:hypothetical protein